MIVKYFTNAILHEQAIVSKVAGIECLLTTKRVIKPDCCVLLFSRNRGRVAVEICTDSGRITEKRGEAEKDMNFTRWEVMICLRQLSMIVNKYP